MSFDAAVANLPAALLGMKPAGLPYSPWQLLEHLRITQHDILDFCRNPAYSELTWPDDYWPRAAGPSSPTAWDDCVAQFQRDRTQLQQLARDPAIELEARIPHGGGQTYLRELLLSAPWFRLQGWGCALLSQGGQLPLAGLGSPALLDIGGVECVPQIPDPEHRSERE